MTYANPYTDFAFKRLFGTESNKDILIDFLNCLVKPEHQIADLVFNNTEALPTSSFERKAFFDIRCTAISGQHFIVEMHPSAPLRGLSFFVETFINKWYRSLSEAEMPIKEQSEKGIQQGIQQGIEKARYETALNLRHLNVSEATIMQATGLSALELDNWLKSK